MVRLGPTYAEIDLGAIENNLKQIKKTLPGGTKVMAVVKADAYGHGAVEVAKRALQAGADYLAVANLYEGEALRLSGIEAPILLLSETVPELADEVVQLNLTQTIYSFALAEQLSTLAQKAGKVVKVHVKIDTGMNRIGVSPVEAASLVRLIRSLPALELEGIFTHFAKGEENAPTMKQLREFQHVIKEIGDEVPLRHAANSSATLGGHWGNLNMVRIGLTLYGLVPEGARKNPGLKLIPALAFKTKVVYLKKVPAKTALSYGGTYRTKQATQIATLPVGYADGFSRALSNRGKVLIRGKKFPVVGRVCMDLTLVDVGSNPVAVGDEVVLIGKQGRGEISAAEVAKMLGTISYEIICSIGKRVPRIYVG